MRTIRMMLVDEAGSVVSGSERDFTLEGSCETMNEIEGAVEEMARQALPGWNTSYYASRKRRGRVTEALLFLHPLSNRNPAQHAEWVAYLEKHQEEIFDCELCQSIGKLERNKTFLRPSSKRRGRYRG